MPGDPLKDQLGWVAFRFLETLPIQPSILVKGER